MSGQEIEMGEVRKTCLGVGRSFPQSKADFPAPASFRCGCAREEECPEALEAAI